MISRFTPPYPGIQHLTVAQLEQILQEYAGGTPSHSQILHVDYDASRSLIAAINGTITDQSAAQIPDVRIVVRNVDTGIQRITSSGSAGTNSITDLSPGNYSLQVVKDGFATGEMTGILLQVNQTATLDFRLTVGSSQQTLTVTANLSSVESTTSELGTVFTTKSVNDLPLNGRNFTQLLTLTPGVSPISVAQNSAGGSGWGGLAVGTFTFPAVNGQRNRSNMFLLDGVNDLASFLGNYNYAPIIDDIQEFKVQSHNDLAEFGAVAGGIINVVTKSGTNAFHGSAWEFLRNEQMDARNFFLPTRNPLRQNQFGVAVGAPVLLPHLYNGRNQTYFFFTYEGFRQSQEAQGIVRVPTTAQLTGDNDSCATLTTELVQKIGQTMGGTAGLQHFDPMTGKFAGYEHRLDDPHSLSDNRVTSVHVDHAGTVWAATESGLDKLNLESGKFTSYYTKDGLPSDRVNCILEGQRGHLWMSTNRGISRFDPIAKTVKEPTREQILPRRSR